MHRPRRLSGTLGSEDSYLLRLGALELEHVRSFREVVAKQCEDLVDQLVVQYAAALEGLRHGPLQSPQLARRMMPTSAGAALSPAHSKEVPSNPVAAALARLQEGQIRMGPTVDSQPDGLTPRLASVGDEEPSPSPGGSGLWSTDHTPSLRGANTDDFETIAIDLDELIAGREEEDIQDMSSAMHSAAGTSLVGAGKSLTFASEKSPTKVPKRIVLFTDMSPECDDECALLYLLSDLNNKEMPVTIDLIMSDSEIRFRWMEYLFRDKFANGKWKLCDGSSSFEAGVVKVNMFLLHSPSREAMVIEEFKKKAPSLDSAPSGKSLLSFLDVAAVAVGPADAILISAPVPDLDPDFFNRFSKVKGAYVVGTPGGVNCQQPSWSGILYSLNQVAPVVYLSPQFTRLVRFPKAYVEANPHWTMYMKRTIFDMALTCMARRPEIPAKFGDWGLVLRLNAANAKLCQGWFEDVMCTTVEDAGECPASIKVAVDEYVERNSGHDRKIGGVVTELRLLGVTTQASLDEQGNPRTPEDLDILREEYRSQLFKCVYVCVLTTESLIFQNTANFEAVNVSTSFGKMKAKSGYTAPQQSLATIFGADEAINILRGLPIQSLTPAYDMVGAICVLDLLESGSVHGLGLNLEVAADSLGRGLFTVKQNRKSQLSVHSIWVVGEQEDKVIEDVVNLLRSQIDSDPLLIIHEFWTHLVSTAHLRKSESLYGGSEAAMFPQGSDMTLRRSLVLKKKIGTVVVHPASPWNLVWSFLGFLLILYDCVTVPLMFFGLTQLLAVSVLTACFWSADVLQSFFLGYYEGGLIEMRLRWTVRQYLRTWFCIDATVVVSSWLMVLHRRSQLDDSGFAASGIIHIVWFVRLLKLFKLPATTKVLSDGVASHSLSHALKMFQVFFIMFGLIHIGGCGWYAVADRFESGPTWVDKNDLRGSDSVYIYITCLQWSFLNLLFTPSDILPTTTPERVYSLAINVGGLMIFSTLLSSLTGFMARIVELRAEQARVDEQVRLYFEDHHLSATLVGQIENYRRHTATHAQRRKLPREQVPGLEELPESLTLRLSWEIFVPLLSRHGFFRVFRHAKADDMATVVQRMMKEVLLLPSNEVFFRDQVAHHFYIVKEGSLTYYNQGTEDLAEPGQWVSELALWVDAWRRKGKLVSTTASVLHSLSIDEFHRCALDFGLLGWMGCTFAEMVARNIQRSEVPFSDLHDLWMDAHDRRQLATRIESSLLDQGPAL